MILFLFIVYTFWCERIALRIVSVKCYLIKHTFSWNCLLCMLHMHKISRCEPTCCVIKAEFFI